MELLENENLFNSLMESIVRLREQGGYLIFLRTQNNRDIKGLGIGAQILKELGVKDFKLLSGSKSNELDGILSGFNLKILERIEI